MFYTNILKKSPFSNSFNFETMWNEESSYEIIVIHFYRCKANIKIFFEVKQTKLISDNMLKISVSTCINKWNVTNLFLITCWKYILLKIIETFIRFKFLNRFYCMNNSKWKKVDSQFQKGIFEMKTKIK